MASKYELDRRRFLKATAGGAVLTAPFIRPAQAQDPIKIGAQGVSSGSHADYGRQIQMGARFAAEDINAKGGIMGRKVEILYRDDELNNDVALKNARFFKAQGVNFMVGTDSSGVCLALGPVLPELDLIQIFTHAATEKLTEDLVFKKGIKQIFRGSVPVYQDAILPALVFKDNNDIKRIANLGADYEYGRTSWAMFHTTLKKFRPDVEIVGEAWAPFFTARFHPPSQRPGVQETGLDLRHPVGGGSGADAAAGNDARRIQRHQGVVAGDGWLRRRDGGHLPRRHNGQVQGQAVGHCSLHLELAGHSGEQGFRRQLLRSGGAGCRIIRRNAPTRRSSH